MSLLSLCALAFVLLCRLPAFAITLAEKNYSADVMLKEVGQKSKLVGKIMVAGSNARLDVDLGAPGVFRAILLTEENTLVVLSNVLKGYVTLPLTGEERDLRDIAAQAARSIMPAGVGAIEILEGKRKDLGTKRWQNWNARVSQSRFVARMMGQDSAISLEVWENDTFAPFPVQVVNLGGDEGQNGDSVELANINQKYVPSAKAFVIPEGYTRYTSVLNMLLYAITGFR